MWSYMTFQLLHSEFPYTVLYNEANLIFFFSVHEYCVLLNLLSLVGVDEDCFHTLVGQIGVTLSF
jgi:hypothetical protein